MGDKSVETLGRKKMRFSSVLETFPPNNVVRGKTLRFSQDVNHVNSKCLSDVPDNS